MSFKAPTTGSCITESALYGGDKCVEGLLLKDAKKDQYPWQAGDWSIDKCTNKNSVSEKSYYKCEITEKTIKATDWIVHPMKTEEWEKSDKTEGCTDTYFNASPVYDLKVAPGGYICCQKIRTEGFRDNILIKGKAAGWTGDEKSPCPEDEVEEEDKEEKSGDKEGTDKDSKSDADADSDSDSAAATLAMTAAAALTIAATSF